MFSDTTKPIAFQGGNMRKVKIGDGFYIGMGICILFSGDIGSESVVGAGAVVVKLIPDHSIAVDRLARVIRSRK